MILTTIMKRKAFMGIRMMSMEEKYSGQKNVIQDLKLELAILKEDLQKLKKDHIALKLAIKAFIFKKRKEDEDRNKKSGY